MFPIYIKVTNIVLPFIGYHILNFVKKKKKEKKDYIVTLKKQKIDIQYFSYNLNENIYLINNQLFILYTEMIVWISVVILIFLFMVQRFGTDRVGYTFAPILCIWFAFIGGIGLYNIIKFDPTVIKALNPKYIIDYFQRNKKDAWISLGGVILTITGWFQFLSFVTYIDYIITLESLVVCN